MTTLSNDNAAVRAALHRCVEHALQQFLVHSADNPSGAERWLVVIARAREELAKIPP